MFHDRDLGDALAAVRDEHAPGALVLDTDRDFETLDPAVAEQLGLRADALDPLAYDPAWVPDDAPEILSRLASGTFTVGAPGDGGVTWTTQTVPPTVFVKPRMEGSPAGFVDFLIAAALVEAGADLPEHFLGFFGDAYPDLAAATPLGPADTYQLAYALYEAYKGVRVRETFAGWTDSRPDLHAEWLDAGRRLEPRLDGLAREVATGKTGFPAAAELACSAIRHAGEGGVEIPTPFAALDTAAYVAHGPEYAVRWAEKTFEKLAE
ncbi:DUF7089 family protein [Halosegnis marinus]|uniref:Uncharacterized protein n=1 Tax=Halosegnis marinus TaxID=3034023 RepID=A0ABD5ZNC0_9EURY|nr:hypothetical protein [Halosegnis sp. DT85]